MQTHTKTSASKIQLDADGRAVPRPLHARVHPKSSTRSQLYMDAAGNAAVEIGHRLVVVLAGSFTQELLAFKESEGPVWTNQHATVRLDSRGNLNFHAGANRLLLRPVPATQRVVGLVHTDEPVAFADGFDALVESQRTGRTLSWHAAQDLAEGIRLVAPQ